MFLYSNSIDLAKWTVSEENLKDRANEIAINSKYHEYWKGLASMIYKFLDNTTRLGANVNEVLDVEMGEAFER